MAGTALEMRLMEEIFAKQFASVIQHKEEEICAWISRQDRFMICR